MTQRIAIIAATPLVAEGLAAALAGAGYEVGTDADAAAGADALVLHDANAVPLAGVPVVVVGDAAAVPADDGRPLALLAAGATPAQLRVAVAAVLEGLSLRDEAHRWGASPAAALPAVPGLPGLPFAPEPLTPRELEVFELVGKGLSNRDIGGVLGISAHTAKYHVGQILAKVGAATRAEAVHLGLRLGLIGL
jgi:DNA-binding NarL/FixJ family response regulator